MGGSEQHCCGGERCGDQDGDGACGDGCEGGPWQGEGYVQPDCSEGLPERADAEHGGGRAEDQSGGRDAVASHRVMHSTWPRLAPSIRSWVNSAERLLKDMMVVFATANRV